MSGIMEAVTKSTHGYFKSVPVVSGLFPLPAIAILPSEVSYLAVLAPNHLALNQQRGHLVVPREAATDEGRFLTGKVKRRVLGKPAQVRQPPLHLS
jgi:hypothetical protein